MILLAGLFFGMTQAHAGAVLILEHDFYHCMGRLQGIAGDGTKIVYSWIGSISEESREFQIAEQTGDGRLRKGFSVYTKDGTFSSLSGACIKKTAEEIRPANVAFAGRIFDSYLKRIQKDYFTDKGSGWLDTPLTPEESKKREDGIKAAKETIKGLLDKCGGAGVVYQTSNGKKETLQDYLKAIFDKFPYSKDLTTEDSTAKPDGGDKAAPIGK